MRWMAALALTLLLVSPAAAIEQATPWIGIGIEAGTQGVRIKDVMPQTPAEKAGLKVGDEVLTIDGAVVKKPEELIARVQAKGVGEKVALRIARDKKTVAITLALEARPDAVELLRTRLLGKPAPNFALDQSTGPHAAKLADLAGNVVLIDFWATWCGPCRASLPRISEWQRKYGPKGLRVVGISAEPMDVIGKFAAQEKLPHTIAHDQDNAVDSAYHVPAIPTLVLIDRKGIVRHVTVGGGRHLDEIEKALQPLLEAK